MELHTVEIMRALAILIGMMVLFDGLDTVEALEGPQSSHLPASQ